MDFAIFLTLIKTETCSTKNRKSTIDLFLTNRPLFFQKTRTTETGISDYHKLLSTSFKSNYTRLKPKIIYYRNYKNFNEELVKISGKLITQVKER